jgi:ribonuclease HII
MELIAGVDEAGRGPLAGPVVAAAVILDCRSFPDGINDSKKIPGKARADLYEKIKAEAVAVGVGTAPADVIDRTSIVKATLLAMVEAIAGLGIRPDCVVVDGKDVPGLEIPVVTLIDGDSRCLSVAAASIIAKVTRDRIMDEMDGLYPRYSFAQNKGYGTPDHLEALRRYGPSGIHRLSFAPVASSGEGASEQ